MSEVTSAGSTTIIMLRSKRRSSASLISTVGRSSWIVTHSPASLYTVILISRYPGQISASVLTAITRRQSSLLLLTDLGYIVAINKPYSGTLVPLRYYERDSRVASVMIEVNRKLYMDEVTGEKGKEFGKVASQLSELLGVIKG